MIVPDVNLLVYAYNSDAPLHVEARAWLQDLMKRGEAIGIPWAVSLGFVRIMTHPSVLREPLPPDRALDHVRSWLERDHVQVLDPGPRHLTILEDILGRLGVAGNLTTDAHIAATAIEYQWEVHTNDADFARFPGLRWRKPLADFI